MNHPIKATKKQMVQSLSEEMRSAILRKLIGDSLCVKTTERDRRLSICQACPSFRAKDKRCVECGCFMLIKAKLKGAKCSLGKW